MSILTITTHYLYNKIVYITEFKKKHITDFKIAGVMLNAKLYLAP